MSSSKLRPMLAAQKYRAPGDLWGELHIKVVEQHLKEDGYGIVQPKWDGFRGLLHEGVMQSRSWTPLANEALQLWAKDHAEEFRGIDGEVFSGHNYHPEAFRETTSGIRSAGGSGNIMLVAYDTVAIPEAPYTRRREYLTSAYGLREGVPFDIVGGPYHMKILLCPQIEVTSVEEIFAAEAQFVAQKFEGAIVRRPHLPYKFGRATALGGQLTKVKRGRESYDAQVIGYEERMANQNELTTSALGYAKRSSHQENLVPTGMLGALHIKWVNGPYTGVEQKVGVFRGLTHSDLQTLWETRHSDPLEGRYCEVSVDSATGGYDAARCPVWIRWRDASEF